MKKKYFRFSYFEPDPYHRGQEVLVERVFFADKVELRTGYCTIYVVDVSTQERLLVVAQRLFVSCELVKGED